MSITPKNRFESWNNNSALQNCHISRKLFALEKQYSLHQLQFYVSLNNIFLTTFIVDFEIKIAEATKFITEDNVIQSLFLWYSKYLILWALVFLFCVVHCSSGFPGIMLLWVSFFRHANKVFSFFYEKYMYVYAYIHIYQVRCLWKYICINIYI